MSVYNEGAAYTRAVLGIKVDKAAAALPQTTAAAIFNVTGGKCLITSIVGEVGTIIQNQANNTKLTANPTTGRFLLVSSEFKSILATIPTIVSLIPFFAWKY